MGSSLFECEFWLHFCQDLYMFCAKNFLQNFRNLGYIGGEVENVLTNPPKGISLPDFTYFEPSIVQIRSRFFAAGICTKNGTSQKVTERLYLTYSRGIPHPTKFNQNWHMSRSRRRRRNQLHRVDNDRSREYKVTES